MHLSPKALLLPAILLVMPASLAQEIHDSDHPEVMARLFTIIPEWLHRERRSTCASPFLTTEIIGL